MKKTYIRNKINKISVLVKHRKNNITEKEILTTQLAQQRCHNFVTKSWLTLSQRCGTVKNESCSDVGLLCCDNVTSIRCQDVATTLVQRHHNFMHLVFRPFYYGHFWFLYRHQNVKSYKSTYEYWIQYLASETHPS